MMLLILNRENETYIITEHPGVFNVIFVYSVISFEVVFLCLFLTELSLYILPLTPCGLSPFFDYFVYLISNSV